MKSFKQFLDESKTNESNLITLYKVIEKNPKFKEAKSFMDKEGYNLNKITLAKKIIDADEKEGAELVKKYIND